MTIRYSPSYEEVRLAKPLPTPKKKKPPRDASKDFTLRIDGDRYIAVDCVGQPVFTIQFKPTPKPTKDEAWKRA